ncbi:unnamed protein product [Hydatigera taeniaeformis]|uniref:Zinc finger CCCH domain-containing protein 10 n=1 Tax=Hydatigena taeniaeformis TaxID=6205 RepID=A0A0R3X8U0_HYDTA|nr:unnamed protein product [Hydatigera taeniaeformis]
MQANQALPDSNVCCKDYADANGDVCRDFLRNVCKRGKKCKYRHPVLSPSSDVLLEPIYCHDFQNGVCRRHACKFLHYTKKEEGFFRSHGVTPPHQPSEFDSHDADTPVCKVWHFIAFHFSLYYYLLFWLVTHSGQISQQHLPCQNGNGNALSASRTSESADTTSETTAMVAAAAAAGYLVMQNHGQHQHQYHQHGSRVQDSSPVTSIPTSALPPASAAAVAAAAAATALATTQHHQQRHGPYSETVLTASKSTGIPVMESLLGAVTNSNVLRPRVTKDSLFSSPTSLPPASLSSEVECHYFQRNDGPLYVPESHFCVTRDYQVSTSVDFPSPTVGKPSSKSANYVNPDGIKKPMNSHTAFNQHSQQQQDANTAAAVAAAACFGAMLSQPVAAAAAASHAAVSKPTAGDILSQAVGGECALSMSAPPTVIVPQPSTNGVTTPAPPAPPPPTAVAAAAAAAVAAAVVSSAGPSAAVAAISAAHLATSSLSHAHSATRVSCPPPDTSLALTASSSRYVANMKSSGGVDPLGAGGRHRRTCNSNETPVDVYGSDVTMPLRLNVPPSSPPPPSAVPTISAAAANPSSLGSSAATAAYTATMTTAAAAAAAMAAAVAVEEHNQKKNAAAAAIAAFNESAAMAHEVQNMARIADHASLSPGSIPPSSHATATKSSSPETSNVYPLTTGKPVSHHRLHLPQNRRFSAFDVVDDESYEESYDEDEDDEASSTALNSHRNDRKCARIGRSCSPDRIFGCGQPLLEKPRQRSLSYPTCAARLEFGVSKEESPKRSASLSNASSLPLSPQALSLNSSTGPPRVYRGCGLPPKRAKLVVPHAGDRIVSPSSAYVRRRYQRFPRRVQQIDMESEMDDEEELCYTGDADFFRPTTVVTQPSYRERLHVLKCENARLRLHLQRVVQQRNQLQLENHTLIKQNLKFRNLNSANKRTSAYPSNIFMKPTTGSFLTPETKARLLRSSAPSAQSASPAPNRKKTSKHASHRTCYFNTMPNSMPRNSYAPPK